MQSRSPQRSTETPELEADQASFIRIAAEDGRYTAIALPLKRAQAHAISFPDLIGTDKAASLYLRFADFYQSETLKYRVFWRLMKEIEPDWYALVNSDMPSIGGDVYIGILQRKKNADGPRGSWSYMSFGVVSLQLHKTVHHDIDLTTREVHCGTALLWGSRDGYMSLSTRSMNHQRASKRLEIPRAGSRRRPGSRWRVGMRMEDLGSNGGCTLAS